MKSPDNFRSQVIVCQEFPEDRFDFKNSLLLFDKKILKGENINADTLQFIESFDHRLSLKSGEGVKDFKNFPKYLDRVLDHWPQPMSRSQTLVVLGGGSLGDFAGFVASIVKRGVQLVHIPSTWLAALDSSHGGKTGLNYDGIKNQIGSFYPAEKIFIVKSLLENIPLDLKRQSYGEFLKMALIGESKSFKEMMLEKRKADDFLWRFLTPLVEDKYQVILQDPFETKEIRQILNFGHTFGHALESYFMWPHGDAILQGCFFALEWSRQKQLLSEPLHQQIMLTVLDKFDRGPAKDLSWYKPPGRKVIKKLLMADKKADADGKILFVFLKNIGQTTLEKVSVDELLDEAKRQNWIK